MLLKQTKIPLCGARAGGWEERKENKVRQGGREVVTESVAYGLKVCRWVCTGVLCCLEADVGLCV